MPEAEESAACRALGVPELLERILLQAPMKEVLFAQRVSRDFRSTIRGSVLLQRRLFLLPCDKLPHEMLYGDGTLEWNHSEDPENTDFNIVANPLLYRSYNWLVARREQNGGTFAEELLLSLRGLEGALGERDEGFVAYCNCDRAHHIPRGYDEKLMKFPGEADEFAPRNFEHSWRKMVYCQPATRRITATLYCRDALVSYKTFRPGTQVGEMVDWMEREYRHHQESGERVDID